MDYEELADLLGAYYHEDFEDVWSALDAYLDDAAIEDLLKLCRDIDEFLIATPLVDLHAATRRLGSYVWLGDDPTAYRDWLLEVRLRATEAALAARAV